MAHFQVSMTKLRGEGDIQSSFLHLNVKSSDYTSGGLEDFNTVATINILEPKIRAIRIEPLNDLSSIFPKKLNDFPVKNHSAAEEHKYVQILHKRKTSWCTEAISLDSPDQTEQKSESIVIWTDLSNGEGKRALINVKQLNYDEKLMITVEGNNRSSQNPGDQIQDTEEDANNNMEQIGNVPPGLVSPPIVSKNQAITSLGVETETTSNVPSTSKDPQRPLNGQTEDVVSEVQPIAGMHKPALGLQRRLPDLFFAIANSILITVEVEQLNSLTSEEVLNNVHDVVPPFLSEESMIEPGTQLDFAQGKKGQGQTAVPIPPSIPPTPALTKKMIKLRENRQKIFRCLIQERLIAFGLPYNEACHISDAWNTGRIQQRAWSYRVPKIIPKWEPPKGRNNLTDDELKAEEFAHNFLRHVEIIQGTLDEATCTVIEATFFLMLPHAKMTSGCNTISPNLVESFTSPTFIKDWIQILFAAAHQIKPTETTSVVGLIHKETKLLRKLLITAKKESSKMKNRFKLVQENVESLRKKVLKRIEPNPQWKENVLPQKEKHSSPVVEMKDKPPGYIQIPEGLTADNLFENYINVTAGRMGLNIRRHISDEWQPLGKFNFLERRILFLGITDHMYSTFDTIISTYRHLQELYTPGYPSNILLRSITLLNLLKDKSCPYKNLKPQTGSLLYAKTRTLAQGMDRFLYTFNQLTKLTNEAEKRLNRMWYEPGNGNDLLKRISQERIHINLVVPFTTLSLKLSDNKPRVDGWMEDKPELDEAEKQSHSQKKTRNESAL